MTIDHWLYLTQRRHRREVLAAMRRIANRTDRLQRARVLHEPDGSCCRLEPWPLTMQRITASLADDGVGVAYLAAGHA
jgi:hypothetical protein